MNQDTYYLKIQGKVNIPSPLAIGHNFHLEADCSIVSEQRSDDEDGSFTTTYKMVPITVKVGKDNGEMIKAKDPRRNSEKFRKYLWKLWSDSPGVIGDFDEVYEQVTYEAMAIMPELLRSALKKLN